MEHIRDHRPQGFERILRSSGAASNSTDNLSKNAQAAAFPVSPARCPGESTHSSASVDVSKGPMTAGSGDAPKETTGGPKPKEDKKLREPTSTVRPTVPQENVNSVRVEGGSALELPQVPLDVAPDISDKVESGWAAVAKSIGEVDEQKIRDYKEDIDTILVFAGLYSAVLSALLVESVQNLQPNTSLIAITLLSQLVAQTHTYTIGTGFLNSTVNPLDITAVTTSFQPSLAAKRVNVLWFASLTLALISASFGILVKQWLREYLAGEYVSPQARLRVRHFRAPGLEHWQVFTLAAMLPLLLQLALALFFIGLCFFTLDIHNSIGFTTIPLVGGWALLFVAASFAPSLSPRCPYKIPLFKSIMQVLRNGLFHVISLLKGLPSLPDKTKWNSTQKWTWKSLWYNEEDAAKTARHDVDILVEVDKSQTDDQLLTKICSALREVHTTPEDVVEFVLRIIGLRLGKSWPVRPLPMMLDLSQLPVRTSTILMDTIAEALRREVARYPPSEEIKWTPWMQDCFALLVAKLPCQLSDKASDVMTLCFTFTEAVRIHGTVETILTQELPDGPLALCLHLHQRLRSALRNLHIMQFYYVSLLIVRRYYCTCPDSGPRCLSISHISAKHDMPSPLWNALCELYCDYLLRELAAGVPWGIWHRDLFDDVLIRYYTDYDMPTPAISPWHGVFRELGDRLATNRSACPALYRRLYDPITYFKPAVDVFHVIYLHSTEKEQILGTLHDSFADYVNSQAAASSGSFMHLLRFLHDQRDTMKFTVLTGHDRTILLKDFVPIWQHLWEVFRLALPSPNSRFNPTANETGWAIACFVVIDQMDDLWLPLGPISGLGPDEHFEHWAQTFPVHESFFNDKVIEALMTFLPSFEGVASKRVRRLLWLRAHSEQVRSRFMEPHASNQTVVGSAMSPPLPHPLLLPPSVPPQPTLPSSVPPPPPLSHIPSQSSHEGHIASTDCSGQLVDVNSRPLDATGVLGATFPSKDAGGTADLGDRNNTGYNQLDATIANVSMDGDNKGQEYDDKEDNHSEHADTNLKAADHAAQ